MTEKKTTNKTTKVAKAKPAAEKAAKPTVKKTTKAAAKTTVKAKAVTKKDVLPESVRLGAVNLFEHRAEHVQLLDLRGINDVAADFFLVATCSSEAQMQAILNDLAKEYKANKIQSNGIEYKSGVQWAVLDLGFDLMIHLFEENKRAEIGLDILYRDAKIQELEEKDFIKATKKKVVKTDDFI